MKIKSEYRYVNHPKHGILVGTSREILRNFNVERLNLGNIRAPSHPFDALAVLFDLEGFTVFTSQVDPQLRVPNFVSDFLEWLFDAIKIILAVPGDPKSYLLWAGLPFFCKFMGDGVLFLWKIDSASVKREDKVQGLICNVISVMYDVCQSYPNFLNDQRTNHDVEPPAVLRCGIARGTIIPIGGGLDFVGPCINIAARLQKFNGLTFAFSARGIDLQGFSKAYRKLFLKFRSSIRGIGDKELIFALKKEYKRLTDDDKSKFSKP